MIRFFTLDKKPKLYDALLVTSLTVLLLGFLNLNGMDDSGILSVSLIAACILAVIVLLMKAFIGQLRYNPYSYNTIYYVGFALFLLSVFVVVLLLLIRIIRDPAEGGLLNIAGSLLYSARLFMYLSFPFILVFSLALCISNVSLIRHEGFSFTNILGIIFSFLLVGVDLFIYFLDFYASGSLKEIIFHDLAVTVFSTVYLYIECMLLGTMIANRIVTAHRPALDKDFAIVLGCGIRKDGSPTPLLKGRIDKAVEFYELQKKETGKELTFITSGGQGADEVVAESRAMKNYLLSKGFRDDQVIEEDRSANTYENMKFSKQIIDSIDPESKVIFATNGFHVFRSGLKARRVGLKATGIGSSTRWYFWPNASIREFVGLLASHKLKQAAVLISIFMTYVALIYIVYR